MTRILVVDDDPTVRQIIAKVLTRAGHEAEEVGDGSEAIAAFRERPADLILMDIYMPGADGIEAIIRLQQEFPDVRIIAMSGGGHRDKHDVLEMAARLGAKRTLPKPVGREELLAAVADVLGE